MVPGVLSLGLSRLSRAHGRIGVGVPRSRQGGSSAGNAGADRPDRHSQDLRDLVVGKVTDISKDHGGPELDTQRYQGPVDVRARGHDVGRVSTTANLRPDHARNMGACGTSTTDTDTDTGTGTGTGTSDSFGDVCRESGQGPSATATDLVDTGVGGDAVDPGGE